MRKAALFASIAALSLSAPALAQPEVGAFFVRGSAGFSSQSLEDWNDDIDFIEQALQGSGVPASFDNFGGAIPFGVELGYQVSPMVGISVGLFRQSDSVDNSYGDATGRLSSNADLAITTLTGAVTLWPPGSRGVFLGADLGVGFGSAENEIVFRDYGDPANDFDIHGDWSGNGLVAGAFVGAQIPLQGAFLVHGRLGYQFQNLGEFDGGATSPQAGTYDGPPIGLSGREMDTDFSGLQVLVGVGVEFGGR